VAGLRKYETHPKLVMDALVRHGLFDPERADLLGFESGGIGMVVTYSEVDQQAHLFFETMLGEVLRPVVIHQQIKVGFEERRSGRKPYFLCPESGARCQELHLYEDHFVARKVHPNIDSWKAPPAHRRAAKFAAMRDRVLGLDGSAPAQGKEWDALMAKFVREPFLLIRHPELADDVDRYHRHSLRLRKNAARRLMARDKEQFASALRRGRTDFGPIDISAHLERSPEHWLSTIPEPRDRFGNSPLAHIEDQSSLDLRKLAKAWKLDKRGIWSQGVIWSRLKAVLIADFRDAEHPLIALRQIKRTDGEPQEDIIIKLVPSAFKSRWFMECPLSSQRCEILYWRDDVFASARAARYVHRSQRR